MPTESSHPAADGEPAPTLEHLKGVVRFPILVLTQARQDGLFLKSSALAFVSILALVPLLAVFSFVGVGLFNQYEQHILEFLTHILPYSEETIIDKLNQFLRQAEAIRGLGLFSFLVISLIAFATIEETLNAIWKASSRRPLRMRILSFTLVLFWGPMLVGVTITGLLFVSQWSGFQSIVELFPVFQTIPFVVNLIALTMVYWLVPNATVRFQNALAGGAVAALLLEILRQSFGLYVQQAGTWTNVIYGGFGLALFFMISIDLAWLIVLIGCETAYTSQHFGTLLRISDKPTPPDRLWIGLTALVLVGEGFSRGEPVTPLEDLADRLRITPEQLRRALEPLVSAKFLCEGGTSSEGYLLGGDPRKLRVDSLLELYQSSSREILTDLPRHFIAQLELLRSRILGAGVQAVGDTTLDELLREEGEKEEPEAAEPGAKSPPAMLRRKRRRVEDTQA